MDSSPEFLDFESICPFCFRIYPAGEIEKEIPICVECHAEGRAIMVEPRTDYLQTLNHNDLSSLYQTWEANTQISPKLRQTILQRLGTLLNHN